MYVRLPRAQVALFRFLLEACEGLALFTSLGSDADGREVLCLRCAPGAEAELRAFLSRARGECGAEMLGCGERCAAPARR
jgi:hypothetical protein